MFGLGFIIFLIGVVCYLSSDDEDLKALGSLVVAIGAVLQLIANMVFR